jgi:hypothetical protein
LGEGVQGFGAAGEVALVEEAGGLEVMFDHSALGGVVIDDEEGDLGEAQREDSGVFRMGEGGFSEVDGEPEGGTFAESAVGADVSAHEFDQALRDGQA